MSALFWVFASGIRSKIGKMGSLAYERGRTLRIDGYRRLGARRLDGLGARSSPSASCVRGRA